jgi:hypothetical protein
MPLSRGFRCSSLVQGSMQPAKQSHCALSPAQQIHCIPPSRPAWQIDLDFKTGAQRVRKQYRGADGFYSKGSHSRRFQVETDLNTQWGQAARQAIVGARPEPALRVR